MNAIDFATMKNVFEVMEKDNLAKISGILKDDARLFMIFNRGVKEAEFIFYRKVNIGFASMSEKIYQDKEIEVSTLTLSSNHKFISSLDENHFLDCNTQYGYFTTCGNIKNQGWATFIFYLSNIEKPYVRMQFEFTEKKFWKFSIYREEMFTIKNPVSSQQIMHWFIPIAEDITDFDTF